MEEEWKQIDGFNNKYILSNKGKVKLKSKNLILSINSKNKITLILNKNKHRKNISHLVAKYFIPNPNSFTFVIHKDGNRNNNCSDNLEWYGFPSKDALVGKELSNFIIVEELTYKIGEHNQKTVKAKCLFCNSIKKYTYTRLLNNKIKSCGCIAKPKHPLSANKIRLRGVFKGMKKRCYSDLDKSWHIYGGRGIKICEEWLSSPIKFIQWSLENGYKQGLQIDRIDNDGNYEPNNCRFVTTKENCCNK
jgi:hypothetical protein